MAVVALQLRGPVSGFQPCLVIRPCCGAAAPRFDAVELGLQIAVISVSKVDDIIPPIMGTAIRCITSAPVPWLHMIGKSPAMMAKTVIIFGRTRSTAPAMIAARRSSRVNGRPSARRRFHCARRRCAETGVVMLIYLGAGRY
jgi:hypothetical protein